MSKVTIGMLRGTVVYKVLRRTIEGVCSSVCAMTAGGRGRMGVVVSLVVFLSSMVPAVYAQEATPGGAHETSPSGARLTSPMDSTDALMDAYNKKMQRVMEQSDPFYAKDPSEAYSAAEALKDNKEYTKAMELYLELAKQTSDPEAFSGAAEAAQGAGLDEKAIELADEALARYENQYEAMLTKARAYKNLDQLPDARIMIEKAMETMGEDGSGIDAAVMDLYKEIMKKTSGNPDDETP